MRRCDESARFEAFYDRCSVTPTTDSPTIVLTHAHSYVRLATVMYLLDTEGLLSILNEFLVLPASSAWT